MARASQVSFSVTSLWRESCTKKKSHIKQPPQTKIQKCFTNEQQRWSLHSFSCWVRGGCTLTTASQGFAWFPSTSHITRKKRTHHCTGLARFSPSRNLGPDGLSKNLGSPPGSLLPVCSWWLLWPSHRWHLSEDLASQPVPFQLPPPPLPVEPVVEQEADLSLLHFQMALKQVHIPLSLSKRFMTSHF